MTDTTAPAYRPPKLRVSASFAATDGTCPESIEVEFNLDDIYIDVLTAVIQALAAVPRHRYNVPAPPADPLATAGKRLASHKELDQIGGNH